MIKPIYRSLRCAMCLILMVFGMDAARALPLETYAAKSVLAQGSWVKISVSETGMHFIPAATLRSWGFQDPMKVSIYGYGGNRQADKLTQANYIDDLPELPVERTSAGVYFYGVGPVEWGKSGTRFVQTLNPYVTEGFYFVTDSSAQPRSIETKGTYRKPSNPLTTFNDRTFHEIDRYTYGQTGTELYGEDFRYTRSRNFQFDLPGLVEGNTAWMRLSVTANSNAKTNVALTIDGNAVSGTRAISALGINSHGEAGTYAINFKPSGEKLDVGITLTPLGVLTAAHLDYITVNYTSHLRMRNGLLDFEVSKTEVALEGASAETRVWDVTEAYKPYAVATNMEDGKLCWTNDYTGNRRYMAWNPTARMLTPKKVAIVGNQNIHGIEQVPDMIIITLREWAGEAERVANLHRREPDNFNVLVVDQDEVFNEFASGARDPNAFRRMAKMFYDRGLKSDRQLRYLLLFGRPFFDNRMLTDEAREMTDPVMPAWQSKNALTEGDSYTSDDIYGILADNSGTNFPNDLLCISVGRIPVRTLSQAKTYVDKLYGYADNKLRSEWKNAVILEADNGNEGIFMEGFEELYNSMMATEAASNFIFTKVYVDAFDIQGGVCVGGRERFYRMIDEGTLWWFYNGHGATQTLGGEGLHEKGDIETMYNKHLPVLFASTCSYSHWDGLKTSGVETLALNPSGGIIAGISPTRKAFVTDNDKFVRAIAPRMLQREENGEYMRLGDIIRVGKNAVTDSGSGLSNNHMRYVIFGDPAMRLVMPSATVELETINGEEVTEDAQCTIMARQRVNLSGRLRNADGSEMDDFNGQLSVTLYDAEYSTTSNGLPSQDTNGKAVTFEEKGNKLFSGRGQVVDGRFSVDFAMPSEVADNFRPATINLYATSDDGREAIGVNRDFYVYGYDETADPDTIPPTIDYAYLNHSSFADGSTVNEQPMFIAAVSDDTGINMAMAGIGHQMTLKLDDRRTYNDISLYYSPAADGSPAGTIAYPISDLAEGNHTLTFRVWDTDGNSSSKTLNFFVQQGAAPELFDIFTDANPASTHANFYLSHNRPNAPATVTLDIYSISGRHIWSSTVSDQSDMFLSAPIQWNLCDMGGQRVQRGIYIYRATIKIDGCELQSASRRIAVTGH